LSFWSFVHLFLYFRGSLVYFLCTRAAPLCTFNEFELLIKKKRKRKGPAIKFYVNLLIEYVPIVILFVLDKKKKKISCASKFSHHATAILYLGGEPPRRDMGGWSSQPQQRCVRVESHPRRGGRGRGSRGGATLHRLPLQGWRVAVDGGSLFFFPFFLFTFLV